MRDIARIGIGKTKTADTGQAKYKFRGVEDAMNEMSPIMVNHGITVAACYSDLMITERDKGGGKATRFVTLKGTFTFSAEDDSSITAEAYGEAMDSGDKATIKAQSVAFRTALFQLFVVPTMSMDTELDDHDDGATDADGVIHNPGPQRRSAPAAPASAQTPKIEQKPTAAAAPAPTPAAAPKPSTPPANGQAGGLSGGQVGYLRNKLRAAGVEEVSICDRFQVTGIEMLNVDQFDEVKSELLAMT